MKKIYIFLFVLLSIGTSAFAQVTYYSKVAATDFNNLNTWGTVADGTGTNPASITNADNYIVANAAVLSLSANASVRQLTISSGTLSISANSLIVSAATGNNIILSIASGARLNVLGGTLTVNGQFAMSSGAKFAQSGGIISVDGNAAGVVANSVAGNIVSLFSVVATDLQLTGGTFIIVDPSYTTSYALTANCAVATNCTASHTFQFGDGISTDAGGTNGFYSYLFPGTSYLILGNVTANGGLGTNRFVSTLSNYGVLGNLTVNTTSEYRISSITYLAGNLINNGTLSSTFTLNFASYANATVAAATTAQTVSGNGVFRNLTASPTANFTGVTVNNNSTGGVNFTNGFSNIATQPANSVSFSGTLNPTAGKITSGNNLFVLGTSVPAAGTLTYTNGTQTGGFISGTTFGRWSTAGSTGSLITAATDPTSSTSRYPFITGAGAARSPWITRVTPSAAGIISVLYTEAAGTSVVSPVVVDGTYNINTRTNDNWTISTSNGTAAAASYTLAIVAPGVYTAPDATTRIMKIASVVGTHQAGTATPGGQRITIAPADLLGTFYLGYNLPACFPPTSPSVNAITASTANVNFTSGGTSFIVEYGAPGFVPGTAGVAGVGGTVITGTSSPIALSGLTAATTYDVYIRQDCSGSANGYSSNTVKVSFTTLVACPAPTAVATNIVTTTSANVTFTGAGTSYIVEYGAPGFTPGLAATAGTGGTIVTGTGSPIALTGLTASTSYDIYVRQNCTGSGNGFSLNSTKAVLYTGYCVASSTSQLSWISAFSTTGGVSNITHTAAAGASGGYADLTATSVSNYLGQTTNFSITSGGPTVGNAIWVDWNNNLVFETTERMYVSTGFGTTVTGSFAIPAATPNGNYRMRVITDYNVSAPINPCGLIARGEYKDFTFSVVTAPACVVPTAVATNTITTTSANVTFTGAGTSYIVEYGATGFTPGIGATAGTGGTIVTGTGSPIALSGLTPSTTYQVYVRQDCTGAGNGYSSNAGPVAFTTTVACAAPTAVATNTITTTSANVTFTGAGTSYIVEYGATGFTPGTGAGAGTGGTVVIGAGSPIALTGLTPSTTYQVYVRQDCTGSSNGYSTNAGPVSFTTTTPTITSIASGNWNSGSTWNTGFVPACTDLVIIANSHIIDVSSIGNLSRAITIQTGGTLSINSGDITVGCTSNNNFLSNSGTLSVSGGTLNVNGNVAILSGSTFNQSGGNIIIDPNSGVVGTSVAGGTATMLINSNLGTVTAGTIRIVDPNFNSTGKAFDFNASPSTSWATGHTLIIGDPASVNPSANTSGFILEQYTGSGKLALGNLVIDGGAGVNKQASLGSWSTFVNGNLTVNTNSFFTIAAVSAGAVVTGNVTNNGTITQSATSGLILAATTGTTTVVNPNPQTIGGAGIFRNLATTPTAELNTLTINNSSAAGVTIATPLRISGTLTLTAGIVNTTLTNILTVGYNATNVGTLSFTAGRVNGPLKRWISAATGARAFPVGNATFSKNASLNFTAAPTTAGTLTAIFSSAPPTFPNASPLMEGALIVNTLSKQGSWFVDAADGLAGGTYTPTFTGTGTNDIVDFTKTVLVKRPSTGGDWILEGTHITTTGSNTAPVLSRSGMSGFSEFAIGGENNAVLPVTIEFFRGSKLATANYLDWKVTCTSQPSVQLTLERSADGRNFKSINEQTETASRCLQGFNYTDNSPLAGFNYYRLKTTSPDGKIGYSTIVVLLNKEKGFELISLAPNPVKSTSVLSLTTVKGGKIDISVSDLTGKVISKQSVVVIAGNNPITMNFAALGAGTYIITAVNAEGELKTTRFIKF